MITMPVSVNTENHHARFLSVFYQQRLAAYEQLDFSAYARKQLLGFGQEASSLKKFILDCYDEGYQDIDHVMLPINAMKRLQQFLQRLLHFIGETSEQALFYLYPEVIELSLLQPVHFDGETFELNDLLESLEYQAEFPVDIRECFSNQHEMQQWEAKTAIIMFEMLGFMVWTLQQFRKQPSSMVPVFLLRDTLLLYFGYVWLFRKGLLSESPQPLLLNRQFLRVNEGSEDFYETHLTDTLYQALAEHPRDTDDFSMRFSQIIQSKAIPLSFQRESRAYLQRLAGSRPIFMVESGVYGTMPLWVLSQYENQGTFVLYATAPWLYEVYRDNTFQKNYNYLRDMETSVAQNFLFQFRSVENQRILVNKTSQPLVEKLALYELHHFRRLLEESNLFT